MTFQTSQDALSSLKASLRQVRRSGELELHERVDLRAWTAVRVGGVADVVVRCHTVEAVQVAVDLMAAHGRQWIVFGAGSSIVPPDQGLRCPVLKLSGDMVTWETEGDAVIAGAGANLTQLCRSVAQGETFLDFKARGSTTVGAAVLDQWIRSPESEAPPVDWIEVVRPGVPISRVVRGDEIGSDTPVKNRQVVVRCRLPLVKEGRGSVTPHHQALRYGVGGRTVGGASGVFLDPGQLTADTLLFDAGAQGLGFAGARVSDESCNSIVTSHRCTTEDIVKLCREMRRLVCERVGVELEPRLRFLDQNGERVEL